MTAPFAIIRDLVRSPSAILFARLFGTLLSVASSVVVARSVGPSGRGEVAAALAAFYLTPILISFGVALEVRRRSSIQQDEASSVRGARLLTVLLFFPSLIVAVAAYFSIFQFFDSMSAAVVSFVGVTAAPFSVWWFIDQSYSIAQKRYFSVAIIQVCQPACFAVTVILSFFVVDLTVAWVLALTILSTVATAVVGSWRSAISLRGSRDSVVGLFRSSVPYSGGSIAEATNSRFDQLVMIPLIGSFGAGLYAVAVTVSSLLLTVGHAVGAAYFRDIARSKEDARALLDEAVRVSFVLSFAAALVASLCAPFLVPFLFGNSFAGAVLPTIIALSGGIFMTSGYVASNALNALGRGWYMTISQLASLTIGIVVLVSVGWRFGASGAAASSAIGSLFLFAVSCRLLGVRPSCLIPRVSDARVLRSRLLSGSD